MIKKWTSILLFTSIVSISSCYFPTDYDTLPYVPSDEDAEATPQDTKPPSNVELYNSTIQLDSKSIWVFWDNPEDEDYVGISISVDGTDIEYTLPSDINRAEITVPYSNRFYFFYYYTFDESGNQSELKRKKVFLSSVPKKTSTFNSLNQCSLYEIQEFFPVTNRILKTIYNGSTDEIISFSETFYDDFYHLSMVQYSSGGKTEYSYFNNHFLEREASFDSTGQLLSSDQYTYNSNNLEKSLRVYVSSTNQRWEYNSLWNLYSFTRTRDGYYNSSLTSTASFKYTNYNDQIESPYSTRYYNASGTTTFSSTSVFDAENLNILSTSSYNASTGSKNYYYTYNVNKQVIEKQVGDEIEKSFYTTDGLLHKVETYNSDVLSEYIVYEY